MAEREVAVPSAEDDVEFSTVPASALNITSRMILSKFLNPEMPLMSSANFARDFRGLAQQMDYDYMDIRNFQCKPDPTSAILDSWVRRPNVTIKDLMDMLEKMDRYDAIEDGLPHFKNDAKSHCRRKKSTVENPIQVQEVTSCRAYESSLFGACAPKEITLDDLITGGDTQYDAYVCYAEEDQLFVHKLAQYLECPDVGLKLCIKGRDVLLGNLEFDSYVRLIEKRCKVLLLILTPEFLGSKECEFQMNYAAGLAVEQRQRKLIPIVLRPCEIPLILKFLTKLDFTRAAIHDWMWNKLVASIRGVQSSFYMSASTSSAHSITGSNSMPSLPSSSQSPPMIASSSQSPPMLQGASRSPAVLSGSSASHPFLPSSPGSPPLLEGACVPSAGTSPTQSRYQQLSSSPQPVITFPPTQTYQVTSPDVASPLTPPLCVPITVSTTATPSPSQNQTSPPAATTPKNTPPAKQKWFRHIKERFSHSNSSTSTSSSSSASSATSGFHSQSGEIQDNESSM